MRANGFRCGLLLGGVVGFLAALGSACDLNPQPQPPGGNAYTPTPAEPAVGADGGGGGASSGGTLTLGDAATPLSPPPKSDAGASDAAFSADATAGGDAQGSGASPDASADSGDAASDADAALADGPCQESGE